MKRRLSVLIIVLLTLSMICGLTLAACKNKNKGGDVVEEKPWVDQVKPTDEMLRTIWDRIASGITIGDGRNFVVDVDVALNIDDRTDKNKDMVYKLVARGKVDVVDKKDSELYIELSETDVKTSATRVLFGLAWDDEVINGRTDSYIYLNLMNNGYRKYNGYSFTQLVSSIVKDGVSDIKVEYPKDVVNLLLNLMSFFEPKGTITDKGNTYLIDMHLSNLFAFVGPLLKDNLLDRFGIDADLANNIAVSVAESLGLEGVKDIGGLCSGLSDMLKFTETRCAFRFDSAGKFVNADLSIDYKSNENGTPGAGGKYVLNVNRARLDLGEVNVFAGSSITDKVRAQEAINLLNMSIKGTAVSYKGDSVAHRYSIELQSDLNAAELLALVGDRSKANILSTLKKLGYFHLEINEVNEAGEKQINIITVHSKFDEGFAVVNADLYDAVMLLKLPIGLGGVYDFEGLIDVIDMLRKGNEGSGEPGGPGEPGGDPGEGSGESGPDIIGLITDLIDFVNYENVQENGVTVELKKAVTYIVNKLGVKLDGTLSSVLDQVLDCDTVNIRLETPTFGTCTEVATSTVECGIRTASAFKNGKTDFISEIKSLDGLNTTFILNEDKMSRYINGSLEAGKCFAITGYNLKGQEVKTSGFIMAMKGLDLTKTGKQEVTFYVAIGTDLLSTLYTASMITDINVSELIPLYGVVRYTTEVNVIGYDESANASYDNMAEPGKINLGTAAGKSWFSELRSGSKITFTLNGIPYEVYESDAVITKDGKDVTEAVLADGMNKAGKYVVVLDIGGYRSGEYTFLVDDAYLVREGEGSEPESIALGATYDVPVYKVITVDSEGNETETSVAPVYKMNYTVMELDEIFDIDNGAYTLKKNLDFVGKKFTISYTVTLPSGNKELKVEIPITGPALTKGSSLFYFGKSFNGYFGLTVDGKAYSAVYEGGKWVLKGADGATMDVTLTAEWSSQGSGNAVTFDDKGRIANYANENKSGSRTGKVYYTINYDGYYYSGYFTMYELYAGDRTADYSALATGDKLDGYIMNVNKIEYYSDGTAAELEFKYGASGYGLYVKGTDNKVYDVAVKVFDAEGDDVTATALTDGAFNAAGTYKVTYDIVVDGLDQNFFHNVKVK